jgi:hypothetical protein
LRKFSADQAKLRLKRQNLLAGTWQIEEKKQIQSDNISWLFFLLLLILTLPIYSKDYNLQKELTVPANHFLRALSLENKPVLRNFQVNKNLFILWNEDERNNSIYLGVQLFCILKSLYKVLLSRPKNFAAYVSSAMKESIRPCTLLASNFALY